MNSCKKIQAQRYLKSSLNLKLMAAYDDPAVQENQKLERMIQQALSILESTGNIDQVNDLLCIQISNAWLTSTKQLPKSIVELYFQIKQIDSEYDGVVNSATQSGLTWFEKI